MHRVLHQGVGGEGGQQGDKRENMVPDLKEL